LCGDFGNISFTCSFSGVHCGSSFSSSSSSEEEDDSSLLLFFFSPLLLLLNKVVVVVAVVVVVTEFCPKAPPFGGFKFDETVCFFCCAEELLLDDIGNNFLCMDGDTAFTTFSNSGDDMFVCVCLSRARVHFLWEGVSCFFSLPPFFAKLQKEKKNHTIDKLWLVGSLCAFLFRPIKSHIFSQSARYKNFY
jgi:hypothetical protein